MKLFLALSLLVAVASAGNLSPGLLLRIKSGEVSEFIIELPQIMNQIESNAALQSLSGDEKVTALVAMLEGLSSSAQAPFVALIKDLGLSYESFWASNIILVKGLKDVEQLLKLAEAPGDFILREQHTASIYPVIVQAANFTKEDSSPDQTVQWGVSNIRCNTVWSRSQGEGTVVGIIDTGVNEAHVALSAGYAGAWRDPYYSTARPTDQNGHGSHCAGSAVGRANGVGCAPAARWVACRGLNHQGSGSESALTTCAQFMLTASPRPTVVSNSWGGGGGSTWYNSQVTAWQNAGIIPVFAMGNSGPACRTGGSPGDQSNLIAVGSTTNSNNAMSSFSSRGPATGTNLLKPEVAAPGSSIVSCGTGSNNYATLSGTSMATPHVAGAIALIKSINPSWNYARVRTALIDTTTKPTLTAADRACGLLNPGVDFPNCAYGYGKIDVARAVGM